MKNDLGVDPHEWFDDKHVELVDRTGVRIVI